MSESCPMRLKPTVWHTVSGLVLLVRTGGAFALRDAIKLQHTAAYTATCTATYLHDTEI